MAHTKRICVYYANRANNDNTHNNMIYYTFTYLSSSSFCALYEEKKNKQKIKNKSKRNMQNDERTFKNTIGCSKKFGMQIQYYICLNEKIFTFVCLLLDIHALQWLFGSLTRFGYLFK